MNDILYFDAALPIPNLYSDVSKAKKLNASKNVSKDTELVKKFNLKFNLSYNTG